MSPSKNPVNVNLPRFDVGPALQVAIANANKAVLELMLLAAREAERDPLAPALLGMSEESLKQLAGLQMYDVLCASRIGAPIFKLRFEDPAVLRTLLETGFSSDTAIREITKTMPLVEIKPIKQLTRRA